MMDKQLSTEATASTAGGQTSEQGSQLSRAQMQTAVERLRDQQNLAGALVAGLAASIVGAVGWAAITVASGYEIGWVAIGVGFIVGVAVRTAGKGVDNVFGICGALLALLGCVAGNLLAVVGIVAQQQSMPFATLLSRLDFATITQLMTATFSPMDLLFYAIALYEGYKLSFRRITREDLSAARA